MPWSRRAGRRYQARRLLSIYHGKGRSLGIKPVKPDVISYVIEQQTSAKENNLIKVRPRIKSVEQRTPYALKEITSALPALPSLNLTGALIDPRVPYYTILRRTYLHYYYGGSRPSNATTDIFWPEYTEDDDIIRCVTREVCRLTVKGQLPPLTSVPTVIDLCDEVIEIIQLE